jgi:xanthine dehydrogenase large subunit
VQVNGHAMPFPELVREGLRGPRAAVVGRLLRDAGLHWDRVKLQGRPFYYYAYGAA